MYPVLFTIRGFEVTSFGAMLGIAALVALRMFGRELGRSHLPSAALDAALAGLVGGIVGAKVIWAIEFRHEAPLLELLLSRGGLSWFGGFIGGVGTGLWVLRRQHLPILAVLAAAAPALAIGHAIGRIGCFLVGDDYGRPSDLPWAIAFPSGRPPTTVPVHPTQLYEAAALTIVALALVALRKRARPDRVTFGTYLLLAGSVRFGVEFFRVNAHVFGSFTLAQIFSLTAVGAGFVLLGSRGRAEISG